VVAGTGNIEIRRLLDGTLFNSIPITDTNQVTFYEDGASINPSVDFDDASAYYITFGPGVFKDLAGNAFGGATISYFTTADQTPPVLLNMTPGIDATNVAVDANIVLTFNEPVQPGWNSFSLRILGQPSLNFDVNDTTQVTYAGNTVTINPSAILAAGTTYIFDIGTYAVKDLNGNGYYSQTYNFTTAPDGVPPPPPPPPPPPSGLAGTSAADTLVGGTGNDTITGRGRGDTLTGAGGADTFVYTAVSDSTGRGYDTITDFNASADLFDLWVQVTGIDTAITSGSLSPFTIDSNLASSVGAAKLGAHHAVLFTPNAGMLSGKTFLIVDANGVAGYQASADLIILLGNGSSLAGLTAADFI